MQFVVLYIALYLASQCACSPAVTLIPQYIKKYQKMNLYLCSVVVVFFQYSLHILQLLSYCIKESQALVLHSESMHQLISKCY